MSCHGFTPESWSVSWDPSGTMEMEELQRAGGRASVWEGLFHACFPYVFL